MTRHEAEAELSEVRARIARLQVRELFRQTRLRRIADQGTEEAPRPGWPIARADHASGCRISTSASPRIAV
jgi:hypothetical protein